MVTAAKPKKYSNKNILVCRGNETKLGNDRLSSAVRHETFEKRERFELLAGIKEDTWYLSAKVFMVLNGYGLCGLRGINPGRYEARHCIWVVRDRSPSEYALQKFNM
jgi:hypothetical protein